MIKAGLTNVLVPCSSILFYFNKKVETKNKINVCNTCFTLHQKTVSQFTSIILVKSIKTRKNSLKILFVLQIMVIVTITLPLNIMYLDYVFVGETLMWFIVFGVLKQHFVHVGAGILVQLIAA